MEKVLLKEQLPLGAKTVPTLQSASPAKVPNLSSNKLVIFTDSTLSLFTTKVKSTSPPVSGIEVGLAVLETLMVGLTLVIVTVASSKSLTPLATAVTVSLWVDPTSPDTLPTNEHS